MKTDVMPSIVQMEAEELRKLTTEVKETIARDVELGHKASRTVFGVADLWNIRRSMKTMSSLRRR